MSDRTEQLRHLMQVVGINSFKDLGDRAQISRRAIDTIRQGCAERIKYQDLYRLSQVYKLTCSGYASFSSLEEQTRQTYVSARTDTGEIDDMKSEYQRLQQKLDRQKEELRGEFEQEALQKLESMLLQLPTAAYAAQNNPAMPARNLVPLLRPLDDLLKAWGIERIALVGERVSYDPHWHELMDGEAELGTTAIVRYVGYTKQGRLLYRARVSAVQES
ncbi:MAG: nucleotide exchange factor GrpE [Pseudanabaena sp. RU_4_16]|nr:nucleotide exchange factor GrpE [Pseudanabaena sp. RU_4_16]